MHPHRKIPTLLCIHLSMSASIGVFYLFYKPIFIAA